MDVRSIVESVVREVLQEQVSKKRVAIKQEPVGKVLFVFCDSSAHESFTDQFIELKNVNIAYDILFLDGETASWLGNQHVEASGANRVIATDMNAPAAMEVPKDYDGIIIPEIDLDNAARVAAGMKGTIKSEIIFSAILLEKFILIGDDNPGIKRADRRCLKTLSLPKPYRALFDQYIETMRDLGVHFRPPQEFVSFIKEAFPSEAEDNSENEPEQEEARQNTALPIKKKFLTAEWIENNMPFPNNKLTLPKGVIVSPLAQDILKENQVTLHYTDKG
ncbi:hypothetical protein [Bacillus piscicola]|uniref:hypothetical protein n=1 Tax=Bacillus piscicola TaxID=1632684 RepID=UPI001F09C1B4|nr:hypothetical protein [Bacillus piscicola]